MSEFGIVVDAFLSLDKGFQLVIADITKRMGEGMAEFIEKEASTTWVQESDCRPQQDIKHCLKWMAPTLSRAPRL